MVKIMVTIDIMTMTIISLALLFIGALGIILLIKPLDKVIMFAVMEAGFVLSVVTFKYLDVALGMALFAPISTIILLLSVIKINEIRKRDLDKINQNIHEDKGSDEFA